MNHLHYLIGRWIAGCLAMLGLAYAGYHLVVDNMPKGEVRLVEGYQPWSEQLLRQTELIPVQDGGRIKPLSTHAGFTMLSLHGARSMKIRDGKGNDYKIGPTAWMMDVLLRPQLAMRQPTFRVDNSAALEAIGVEPRGRRDRYSYEELLKGREKLIELAQAYQEIDAKRRDPVQGQVVDLATNLRLFESLLGYFNFARNGVLLEGFEDAGARDKRAEMSAMMVTAPELQKYLRDAQRSGEKIPARLNGILNQIIEGSNTAKYGLFLVPPSEGSSNWRSAGEVIMGVMSMESRTAEADIADISTLEQWVRSTGDEKRFLELLDKWQTQVEPRLKACKDGKHVALEANYYHRDWFLNALVYFLLGSLGVLAMWVFGGSLAGRIAYWFTMVMTGLGAAYCATAIVIRCIIMERPPVGNLYDTIIFIGATGTLISMLVEAMTKRRFALGIGPIMGTALVLLARRYELGDAQDHMDPLVAVLDSNYWLTTHVITITLGYTAGLLSAFLSAAYVLMRGLGLDRDQVEFRRILTRVVYGMICFTLFLSLVGTVLGGIWANDSWGRFWGWDPKENGALLIVLWTLAILHARLGGYVREVGLHLASLFTAVVVTFSWWHVNFLGVGLHNYGFTSGKDSIWLFYIVIASLITFGAVTVALEPLWKGRQDRSVG